MDSVLELAIVTVETNNLAVRSYGVVFAVQMTQRYSAIQSGCGDIPDYISVLCIMKSLDKLVPLRDRLCPFAKITERSALVEKSSRDLSHYRGLVRVAKASDNLLVERDGILAPPSLGEMPAFVDESGRLLSAAH